MDLLPMIGWSALRKLPTFLSWVSPKFDTSLPGKQDPILAVIFWHAGSYQSIAIPSCDPQDKHLEQNHGEQTFGAYDSRFAFYPTPPAREGDFHRILPVEVRSVPLKNTLITRVFDRILNGLSPESGSKLLDPLHLEPI